MQRCTRLRLRHIILEWIQQPLGDGCSLRRRLFAEHVIHSVVKSQRAKNAIALDRCRILTEFDRSFQAR
jgi:hypothetical protein